MTKKLTPSHIAVAVAAGLTAQTTFAQTPPPQPTNAAGQEVTPMIKIENNQFSGQGFFEKPGSTKKVTPKVDDKAVKPLATTDNVKSVVVTPAPGSTKTAIKDPMLSMDIVGSKDAKENPSGSLTPPLDKKDNGAVKPSKDMAQVSSEANGLDKNEAIVKPKAPVKKKPVVKKTSAKKAVVEAPFNTRAKEVVPMEVKELPSAMEPIAPALYAAVDTTPVMVTEIVRIDSISLQAPTIAEPETQPLPRLPEPVVAAIVPAPVEAPVATLPPVVDAVPVAVAASAPAFVAPAFTQPVQPPSTPNVQAIAPVAPVQTQPIVTAQKSESVTNVPMASASMADLPPMDAPSVESIRKQSRLHAAATPTFVSPTQQAAPEFVGPPAPTWQAPPTVVAKAQPQQESRDARIQALLNELKTLQSNPMVMQSVEPPVEIVPPAVVVPKINPAATIQLPLPEGPRPLIKPTPKAPPRMVTEHAPKAPVDVPQTAAIDAPRTMTPAPVLEPRTHRVANPKFAGLPEKGDFIAFMPGSSHVSEETVASLRSMVDVFKQHGIRKIVLTGTALRDEDSEGLESSEFAQTRARNLKAAFQRAGFKGVIALDDPKRARPGTTPRVGLVALQ